MATVEPMTTTDRLYDDLDRVRTRNTDKRYTFEMTDGSHRTVWADSLYDAEDTLDQHAHTHHSLVGTGVSRLRWIFTSTALA